MEKSFFKDRKIPKMTRFVIFVTLKCGYIHHQDKGKREAVQPLTRQVWKFINDCLVFFVPPYKRKLVAMLTHLKVKKEYNQP